MRPEILAVEVPPHTHIEMKSVNVGEEVYNDATAIDPENLIGTKFGLDGVPISDKCKNT